MSNHQLTWRYAVAILAVVNLSAVGLSCGRQPAAGSEAAAPNGPTSSDGSARADALAFLRRYMAADGRVIRFDQGGDTVSEGQSYAMLLSVATGQATDFAAAWHWAQDNLQRPDGLMSYHWNDGAIVDEQPATDADLDAAWALVLAGRRFDDPTYRRDGLAVASAILAHETTTVAGRLELVAGPWARTVPAAVDPSYLAPEAIQTMATASRDPRWSDVAADSATLLSQLSSAGPTRLPPDWVTLSPAGSVQPVGAPSTSGGAMYGLDAQRLPVWEAASCAASDRRLAGNDWPVLTHAANSGGNISYSLAGTALEEAVSPLGFVAAAASASASGDTEATAPLLARADQQSGAFPTYYGDAWVALGRVLLTTHLIDTC